MAADARTVVERIKALAADHEGIIGVGAKHLGTGEEIWYNPDVIFPTASTMKTILLYELYRQVDAGRVDPAQRLTFEDRHRVPGSGVLQDMDAGINPTIKDIATLMISVSDNTGTDLVYDLIGREAVTDAIGALGLTSTYLPCDTWELLAGLRDLDPNDPALTYEALKRNLGERQSSFDCRALAETPDNNISTPRDMVRLHEAIQRGEGLSDRSRDAVIDILKRQKYSTMIPELLPFGVQTAHKTGSLRGVRNDVGLVYAGDTTYAVALMSKGAPEEVTSVRLLADVSKLIYDHFVGSA